MPVPPQEMMRLVTGEVSAPQEPNQFPNGSDHPAPLRATRRRICPRLAACADGTLRAVPGGQLAPDMGGCSSPARSKCWSGRGWAVFWLLCLLVGLALETRKECCPRRRRYLAQIMARVQGIGTDAGSQRCFGSGKHDSLHRASRLPRGRRDAEMLSSSSNLSRHGSLAQRLRFAAEEEPGISMPPSNARRSPISIRPVLGPKPLRIERL
jgi:hypothetical protein